MSALSLSAVLADAAVALRLLHSGQILARDVQDAAAAKDHIVDSAGSPVVALRAQVRPLDGGSRACLAYS
jgi:hypothetical protein